MYEVGVLFIISTVLTKERRKVFTYYFRLVNYMKWENKDLIVQKTE